MVKTRNKLLLLGALTTLLIGCGSNPINNNLNNYFVESATDVFSGNGITFQPKKIGSSEVVNISSIYAQHGVDSEGNSCLRFATAVQGDINSISYTRKGIDGIGNGADKTIDVTTIYKSILADGQKTFYDGTAPSTTAGEGDYYWACYTICYKSEDASKYFDTDIEMVLTVNGETLATKIASLNDVKNASKENTYFYQAELTNYSNGENPPKNLKVEDLTTLKTLGNINENVGATISFDIESEQAADATMYVISNERAMDIVFDDTFKIEVNGEQISSGVVAKPKVEGYHYWFTYTEKKFVDFSLLEGTNNVKITVIAKESFNIDYFKVVTKANITNSDDIECKQLCNTCAKCIDPECYYHEQKCFNEYDNTYRFEAKDAILSGGNKIEVGEFIGGNGSGKSITYKVNADKDGKASLSVAISPKKTTTLFSSLFTAKVNDADVSLSNIYVKKVQSSDIWYDFVEIGLGCIDLVKGENTITFNGGSTGASFDHIYIDTDCVINNNEQTHYHLCSTCNKSIDMDCRATECAEKCKAVGEKYTFLPSDATFAGNAKINSDEVTIGNVSSNLGATVTYTFSVEKDVNVGMSIELSYQARKAMFNNTMDILVDGENYISGARRKANWNATANWNLYYELNLGCVNLTEGQHTISFVTNTSNNASTSNIRNFFVTSSSTITK